MDKLENCTDFSGLKKMQPSSQGKLIYFQIADNIDFNLLQGLEIDIESKELQLFQAEEITFGVQVVEDQITTQLLALIHRGNQYEKGQQFAKTVKIFETKTIPAIRRKSIKKLKPRSLTSLNLE